MHFTKKIVIKIHFINQKMLHLYSLAFLCMHQIFSLLSSSKSCQMLFWCGKLQSFFSKKNSLQIAHARLRTQSSLYILYRLRHSTHTSSSGGTIKFEYFWLNYTSLLILQVRHSSGIGTKLLIKRVVCVCVVYLHERNKNRKKLWLLAFFKLSKLYLQEISLNGCI